MRNTFFTAALLVAAGMASNSHGQSARGRSQEPCETPTFDGRTYSTVRMGEQCWFRENLHSTHYANGDAIPNGASEFDWVQPNRDFYTDYGKSESIAVMYGKLYNWYAVQDPRGLCPEGWHVSTDDDWQALEVAIGMDATEVGKPGKRGSENTGEGAAIKDPKTWPDGREASDKHGFTATPGGARLPDSSFHTAGSGACYWTATAETDSTAWFRGLGNLHDGIYRSGFSMQSGFSVRCVQDGPHP